MSKEVDLKVLALSKKIVAGNPCLLVNHLKAWRNDIAERSAVNLRWMAMVDAQVNKHT